MKFFTLLIAAAMFSGTTGFAGFPCGPNDCNPANNCLDGCPHHWPGGPIPVLHRQCSAVTDSSENFADHEVSACKIHTAEWRQRIK